MTRKIVLVRGDHCRTMHSHSGRSHFYVNAPGTFFEEEKEIYYSITAEMILAQPPSHSGADNNPGTLAARV